MINLCFSESNFSATFKVSGYKYQGKAYLHTIYFIRTLKLFPVPANLAHNWTCTKKIEF